MFPVVQHHKDHILNSFSQLIMVEETHEYFIDKIKPTSVSKVIERFYEPFDAKGQSEKSARYSGKSATQLQAQWKKAGDDACALGHKVHNFGELRFYDDSVVPTDGFEVAIMKFWKALPKWFIPVLCETRVYNKKKTYAGTFDLLFYDLKREGLIIADYKTNKDLFKNYKGKKMLLPFDFLLDSPYNHYQLQQSLYQIPLEEIGLKVLDRWLIHLIPDSKNPETDGNFLRYELYDYTKHLTKVV